MKSKLNNDSAPDTDLSTAKYVVENPEYAEYLRWANRRRLDPKEVAQKIKKWAGITLVLIGLVWAYGKWQKSRMGYQTGTVQIGRTFRAMFSSLDQEKKIWDTIEGRH